MQDAFEGAQQEALHYHGHDAYNGTISTVDRCTECVVLGREFKKDTDINDFIEEMFEEWLHTGRIKKWDVCIAIKSVEQDDTWIFTGLAAC